MTYLTEHLMFKVPLTADVYRLAEKLSREQKDPQKARQVYLNSLAVSAVDFYCQCMEVETEAIARESEHLALRSLMDIADLEIEGWGKLECRPVLPGAKVCPVPSEVLENRVGYVVVEINEQTNRATLLGFAKTVPAGELVISQLESLEGLIDCFPESAIEPVYPAVALQQWFDGVFEEGWQAVDAVISPRMNLGFARGGGSSSSTIKRAKVIDLGLLLNGQTVALVINLQPEANSEVGILVQVLPMGEQKYLPTGLKLKVNLESDSAEVEARTADNLIQLEFSQRPSRTFNVQVSLGDAVVTEEFAA